jgi:hypothetical protein
LTGFRTSVAGYASYRIDDIGMAAFAVFFMQSPSFLAHQRRLEHGHGRSNCESLFAIAKIPSDTHIRDLLDPAEPALRDPVFAAVATSRSSRLRARSSASSGLRQATRRSPG